MKGLPVPAYALIAASTTAESRSALAASPGLAVWMGRVRITKQRHDPRSIVEVDHGRGGAAGCDDVGLIVVADERCHVMPMLVQIR
jgi:hypothetical protein